MTVIPSPIQQLKDEFEDSDFVWFFVDVRYRIVAFNRKAAENSMVFHQKEIAAGQSILDFARDTKNQVDSAFIEAFGKAASGQQVKCEQHIRYNATSIVAKSVYTPLMEGKELLGISITVEYSAK